MSKIYYDNVGPDPVSLFLSAGKSASDQGEYIVITYETDSQNGAVTKFYVTYNNWAYLYEISYIKK